MNYDAAVRYLLSLGRELAAPTQAAAAKFNLENITILTERLGRPQSAYSSIHIAGTNGKGSTAAFLEAILRRRFRTGLYISPHLEKINERIRVNGEEIGDDDFAATFTRVHVVIEELLAQGKLRAHPTYFECVTAMAFEYFAQRQVQYGIFEVGLGGRLDATNILTPAVTIITNVSFDHENFLGHSLREIAGEKAGILKTGVPVVMAGQLPAAREVILNRARELGCPVIETDTAYEVVDLPREAKTQGESEPGHFRASVCEVASGWCVKIAPSLSGRHQLKNAVNAIAAARLLQGGGIRITDEDLARGLADTVWPGRLERLQSRPAVYLDGAHNPAAARELAAFINENFAGRKIFLIYGALRDKSVDEIAGLIFPLATEVILTEASTPRAISALELEKIAGHYAAKLTVMAQAERAFEYAVRRAEPDDTIFITGSLYLVGQLRAYWKRRP